MLRSLSRSKTLLRPRISAIRTYSTKQSSPYFGLGIVAGGAVFGALGAIQLARWTQPDVAHTEPIIPQAVQDTPKIDPAEQPLTTEEEEENVSAYDPVTGEINWDCPCLGGMAHGPCGEEFKAAFSCFIYSEEETKGADCIDKFRGMQDCFRLHPEVYSEGMLLC